MNRLGNGPPCRISSDKRKETKIKGRIERERERRKTAITHSKSFAMPCLPLGEARLEHTASKAPSIIANTLACLASSSYSHYYERERERERESKDDLLRLN